MYVIGILTGEEESIKNLIETAMPEDLYEDCFIIKHENKRKCEGSCTKE